MLVLVGAPGAGKSTIGQLVAAELGVGFRDTDIDVVAVAGKPITDIFFDDGEVAFRQLERDAVAAALAEHDGVLALGGGAILDPTTRHLLADHRVVFLDVGLADAATRVGLNRDRPLLLASPRAAIKRLLDERRPLYLEVADQVIDTAGRSVDDVLADVLKVCR